MSDSASSSADQIKKGADQYLKIVCCNTAKGETKTCGINVKISGLQLQRVQHLIKQHLILQRPTNVPEGDPFLPLCAARKGVDTAH